jgi:hypothetical protein
MTNVVPQPALAAPGTRCVAPGGTGCDVATCGGTCFASVQDAVDAAVPDDEIRIATGTYTGVHARGEMTQVVYISKTVAVRGGYSSDLTVWDRDLYPTTLDAQGQGRVISIINAGPATVESLHITGGNAHGLTTDCPSTGGQPDGCGGGIFVLSSAANILGNTISNNVAAVSSSGRSAAGGGICLAFATDAVVAGNVVISNVASLGERGMGGGILTELCHNFTVAGNHVLDNRATTHESLAGWGGGIAVHGSGATGTIEGNVIEGNRTNGQGSGYGAAIYQWYGSYHYVQNYLTGNHGAHAVYLGHANALVDMNQVVGNSSSTAFYLNQGLDGEMTLVNNIIAAGSGGDSLTAWAVEAAPLCATLVHNTIVGSGSGNGVLVNGPYVTLSLTNTIVANYAWGITNTTPASSTVFADYTLFWANVQDGIRGTSAVDGDPAFANPGAGDYHLRAGSAAIDAAVEAGVATDIDGDDRPLGPASDIGADEARLLVMPLVLRGA